MSRILNKETLVKTGEGVYTLCRNGFQVSCPLQPPLVLRSNPEQQVIVGQPAKQNMTIKQAPCTNLCAQFSVQEEGDKINVTLGCCGKVMLVDFEDDTEQPNLKKV